MRYLRTMVVLAFALLLCLDDSTLPASATPGHAETSLPLTDAERLWLREHPVVYARISPTYPPFEFLQDGRYQGLAVDYLDLVAQRLGIRFEPVDANLNWSESLERLRQKAGVDLILMITRTAERERDIEFTRDYFSFPLVIFNRKDGYFISGIKDLNGRKIAVERGFIAREWLKRDVPNVQFTDDLTSDTALSAVSTGKADAYVGNLAVGCYFIERHGLVNLRVAAPTPYGHDDLAMGVRKDWPQLATLINKAFDSISEEEQRAIRMRWLTVRYEHGLRSQDVVLWVLLVAAIGLLFIVQLRRLVKSRTVHLEKEIAERTQAEQALQESRSRYQILVDSLPLGINLIDTGYRVVMSNATMGKWFSKEANLFVGQHCFQAFEKRPAICQHCPGTISMQTGKFATAETEGVRDDGSHFAVRISTVPLRDQGNVAGFIEVVEDITLINKANKTLQLAQERVTRQHAVVAKIAASPDLVSGDIHALAVQIDELAAQALDVERVGVWLFDNTEDELRCLDLYEKSPGRHSAGLVLNRLEYENEFEALKTARYVDAHDPLTDPRTAGYVEKYLKPLQITSMLDAVIRESGRNLGVICFEHVGQAHKWEAEEIAFACQIADQIAIALLNKERKLAAEELSESEARYRAMINSARDIVFVVDLQGRLVSLNPAFETATGFLIKEWLGRTFMELLHPDDAREALKRLGLVLNGEQLGYFEYRIRTSSGGYTIAEIQGVPLLEKGVVGGVVGFARDVTENRMLTQQLVQTQKMEAIGTLAGGIAHDFNNILAPIIGYAELALMLPKDDPKLAEYLKHVMDAATRATGLVRQILTFSRKAEQKKIPLQISSIVKEALKLLRSSIPTSIEIRQDIATQAQVLADPTQIHQIVLNLCTNAYQAMEQMGGVLAVTLKEAEILEGQIIGEEIAPGRYVVLEVSDTGCGMREEVRAKIFEPYFTTKEKGKGTGLGLAVVHGIVKDHKGRITVYSEPGRGTTFKVYLPATASETTEVVKEPVKTTPTERHERILFVDDEEKICTLVRDCLTGYGYSVEVCSNGRDAIFALEQDPDAYDLLITDMTMPGLNGKEVSKKALALRPDLPVILCTGYSSLIDREEAARIGIRDYLEKPVTMSDMLRRIKKLLSGEAAR